MNILSELLRTIVDGVISVGNFILNLFGRIPGGVGALQNIKQDVQYLAIQAIRTKGKQYFWKEFKRNPFKFALGIIHSKPKRVSPLAKLGEVFNIVLDARLAS